MNDNFIDQRWGNEVPYQLAVHADRDHAEQPQAQGDRSVRGRRRGRVACSRDGGSFTRSEPC
jgi:hypothetical protein